MLQTQCPNCGGYKVTSEIVEKYTTGHSLVYNFVNWLSMGWLFVISVGAAGLGTVIGVPLPHTCVAVDRCTPPSLLPQLWTASILLYGGIVLFCFWFAMLFIGPLVDWLDDHRPAQAVGRSYTCELCGYRWTVRNGEPQPKGSSGGVNKRLIELGEDLQRRQNETIAAALYQQEQERKRRQNQ